jgi:hypothetical protein
MRLPPLDPEPSASSNSATSAPSPRSCYPPRHFVSSRNGVNGAALTLAGGVDALAAGVARELTHYPGQV